MRKKLTEAEMQELMAGVIMPAPEDMDAAIVKLRRGLDAALKINAILSKLLAEKNNGKNS